MSESPATRVRRGRPNASYTAISNALIDHPDLSPEARIVLIYLLSRPDNWQLQITDVRRVLGTRKKTAGRNKAYQIIRELKLSAYVVAVEVLDEGRFDGVTYYVFDEPHEDPEGFKSGLRRQALGAGDLPQPADQNCDDSPFPQNRQTAISPRPGFRDPVKGDSIKEGKKQKTETPPPAPKRADRRRVQSEDLASLAFAELWNAWQAHRRPRSRVLPRKLFLELVPDDQALAVEHAERYRRRCAQTGAFPVMIPYIRDRLFAEPAQRPAFVPSPEIRLTPRSEEWQAWIDHLRGRFKPTTMDRQEAMGFLVVPTRWPEGFDQDGCRAACKKDPVNGVIGA